MGHKIRKVCYYNATVQDRPGEAYRLLQGIAGGEVNLLAFSAVPIGPNRAQLTLFPDSEQKLARSAERAGLVLDGPHPALLVQGDDELGALVEVHARLADAGINVFASAGVTDGAGCFGYVVYLKPGDIAAAVETLEC